MSDEATPDPGLVWRGPDALVPLLVPIDEVEEDPKNARRHPDPNLDAIKRSIDAHGQLKPIVCKGRRILAGNGTRRAMKALGWNAIARVPVPESMSDSEAIAFAIADNKTTDLSEWDFEELSQLFKELPTELHPLTGFEPFEIEPLLQAQWQPPPRNGEGSEPTGKMVTFVATEEQAVVIRGALAKARNAAGDDGPSLTDGRALELIAADFLAGP